MAVEHLTTTNFDEKVIKGTGTILVDFYANWCVPCKMLAPVVEELAEKDSSLTVFKVNVEDENSLAVRFRVSAVPTLMVFKDGEMKKNHSGLLSKAELEEFVNV